MDEQPDSRLSQPLAEVAAALSQPKLVLLQRIAEAMARPIEQQVIEKDHIFSDEFAEAFGDQLLLHHGTHDEAVNKKTFEYMFRNAAQVAGHQAELNQNVTDAAADVLVDSISFSLKTEAAQRQSKSSTNIQKLLEARWIRECTTREDFAKSASTKIPHHLSRYERIVLLRGLKQEDSFLYSLFEIPKHLLMLTESLVAEDFDERNQYGGTGADVYLDGQRVFRLFLDGSVEKVRIFTLRLDHCVARATWRIPTETG